MYFRKMRPSTTCLYSAASMLPRSVSAICQSSASYPVVALISSDAFVALGILRLWRAVVARAFPLGIPLMRLPFVDPAGGDFVHMAFRNYTHTHGITIAKVHSLKAGQGEP